MKEKEVGELIEDLKSGNNNRNSKGFHYTPKSNIADIGDTLKGKIGENSKGLFGKEVNPKLFYALGEDGALQIFNRNLNIAVGATISFLNDGVHRNALPNTVIEDIKEGKADRNLTPMEGLEYARKLLEEMVVYTFDVNMSEFEKAPTEEDIKSVSEFIDNFEAVPVVSGNYIMSVSEENGESKVSIEEQTNENSKPVNIKGLIREVDDLIEDLENAPEAEKNYELGLLRLKRGELSMMVRDAALSQLGQLLGRETKVGNVDRILFNEDKVRIVDVVSKPHNAYTRVTKTKDGKYESRNIGPEDGVSIITNGGKPAKYTDVIEAMYRNKDRDAKPTIHGDVDLIGLFCEYAKIIETAKTKHLIKDLEGGPDLESIMFYGDELVAFEAKANEACKNVMRMDPQEETSKKQMPIIDIADSLKEKYQIQTSEMIKGLGDTTRVIGAMKEVGDQLESDVRQTRQIGINQDKDDVIK